MKELIRMLWVDPEPAMILAAKWYPYDVFIADWYEYIAFARKADVIVLLRNA